MKWREDGTLLYLLVDEDVENVVIQSISETKSVELGRGAQFNLELKEVTVASAERLTGLTNRNKTELVTEAE